MPALDALPPADRAKLAAAHHAQTLVTSGMRVGLGTGATAAWLVRLLGARRRAEGLDITAVATSEATAQQAEAEGIAVQPLDATPLDLTIDGADEADPRLRLIKGAGGALLREKLVAAASRRMVVIADASKRVEQLGAFTLPVEIVRFGAEATLARIAAVLNDADIEATPKIRTRGGLAVVTDEGHLIADMDCTRIHEPEALDARLQSLPGVVDTGLFLGLADTLILGHASGTTTVINADGGQAPGTPAEGMLVDAVATPTG